MVKLLNMKKICVFLSVALFAISCSTGNVFSLEVGQCFADAISSSSEEVENVDIVDCDKPHLNEIYAVVDLPEGDFPLVFIDEDSAEICYNAFESFVGLAYEYSIYEANFLRPTMEHGKSWMIEKLFATSLIWKENSKQVQQQTQVYKSTDYFLRLSIT